MIINNENELYQNEKYDELIIIYNNEINSNNQIYKILLNRCLCYLKLKKYNNAFNDALKSIEMNDSYDKSWGYLGASLYGLNKLEDALIAYNKAYDLTKKEENTNNIYLIMINDLKKKLFNKKNSTLKKFLSKKINNPQIEGLFNSLFGTIITNPSIVEKLSDSNFQTKLLDYHNNPEEALKDNEILGVLNNLIKSLDI